MLKDLSETLVTFKRLLSSVCALMGIIQRREEQSMSCQPETIFLTLPPPSSPPPAVLPGSEYPRGPGGPGGVE